MLKFVFSNPAEVNPKLFSVKAYEKITDSILEPINLRLDQVQSSSPLISVVIPAKNEELNLIWTIESLSLNRTSLPFEIIVVDNNSTDNTHNLLSRLHIRSFKQTTSGCGPARQLGQEKALGIFILMADADCFYPSGWIQNMFNELSKKEVSCVYGMYSFLTLGKGNRFIYFIYESLRDVIVKIRHINRPYLNALGMNMGYIKEYGLKVGFDNRNVRGEDGRLCFDLMSYGRIGRLTGRSNRVWTLPRTLDTDKNLFYAFIKRVYLEVPKFKYYIKKPSPHNTKRSKNREY